MSNTFAERAANTVLPPALAANVGYARVTGANVLGNNVQQLACTSTAARQNIGMPSSTSGANVSKKAYVEFQAVSSGGSIFIAFKKGSAAATITTATGWEIPSGTSKGFYMSEAVVDDVEAICAPGVTGTLKWYVNSFYE